MGPCNQNPSVYVVFVGPLAQAANRFSHTEARVQVILLTAASGPSSFGSLFPRPSEDWVAV